VGYFDRYVEKLGRPISSELHAACEKFCHTFTLVNALAKKSNISWVEITHLESGSKIPIMNTFLKMMNSIRVALTLKIGKKSKWENSGRLMVDSVAKLYAYWKSLNDCESCGIFASSGILFNHESPRRIETFVTRKIVSAAKRIVSGE